MCVEGSLFLDGGITVADRVFGEVLFKDTAELLHVWTYLPRHPLQVRHSAAVSTNAVLCNTFLTPDTGSFDAMSIDARSILAHYYLSHCYTIAWDRLSNQFLCVCVCMYVCMCLCMYLWARLRSHFSTDIHEIW